MEYKGSILYIGGFELPDKNAAAQRVIGIAKGLRELGYSVYFLNSLKKRIRSSEQKKDYYGFCCYEYKRETKLDYLILANTCIRKIQQIKPNIVIAYNYPGFALGQICRYCKKEHIRCYADVTEWYHANEGNYIYRIIKNLDTAYRMKRVHKKLDGIIAISRYLYEYYKDCVRTIMIPPTIDIMDEKWNVNVHKQKNTVSFVYAGYPSTQKEKLNLVVDAIEKVSSKYKILLNIVGISEKQFKQIYGVKNKISERVKFWGKVSHEKAIEIVKKSNWSIILRENNKVVQAGFPTKLVESISCATPVIANDFSNIKEYLNKFNGILVPEILDIDKAITKAINESKQPQKDMFDYHLYLEPLKKLFVD